MPRKPTKVFNEIGDIEGLIGPHTPLVLPNPSLAPEDFDILIRNRGLRFVIEKALSCPNVLNLEVQTHDPNCKGCENGFLMVPFNCARPVYAIHQQGKLERLQEIQGFIEFGEAVVTFQSYADGEDGTPGAGPMIDLKVSDKLTCLDYSSTWTERIEHSPSGVDRLHYPAVDVEHLQDADGVVYRCGGDFDLTEAGHIRWLGTKRPLADIQNGRGGIYSVLYTFNPQFYVMNVLHELRATKAVERSSGLLKAVRLPQQVIIRRIVGNEHPGDALGEGTSRAPGDGQFVRPG